MRCSVIRIITKLSRLFPHYLVYFSINCNFIIREFLTFVAIVIERYLHSKLRFLFLASFLEEVSYKEIINKRKSDEYWQNFAAQIGLKRNEELSGKMISKRSLVCDYRQHVAIIIKYVFYVMFKKLAARILSGQPLGYASWF